LNILRKVDGPLKGLNSVLLNVHNPKFDILRSRTYAMFQNIFRFEKSRNNDLDMGTMIFTVTEITLFHADPNFTFTLILSSFILNEDSGNHSLDMKIMIVTMTVIIHFNLVRIEDNPSH